MSKIQNFNAFKCKFLGATNFKPDRVSIKSLRFRQSIIVNVQTDSAWSQAIETLQDKGFNITGQSGYPGTGFLLYSDTFKPLK